MKIRIAAGMGQWNGIGQGTSDPRGQEGPGECPWCWVGGRTGGWIVAVTLSPSGNKSLPGVMRITKGDVNEGTLHAMSLPQKVLL